MGSPDPRRRAQGAHLDVIQLCAKPRRAWGTRSRARELYLRACLRGERRERAASNLRINHARARCANRLCQKCPPKIYTRAPLSRRHYLKVAKKSDGGVFSKLHAAPPRTWGGCAAREGGGWRGGSARAARRVAHLGGSARAARRGWWWGRHLSRRAGHCAPSSRGRRHGGVGRAAWHERGYSCCLHPHSRTLAERVQHHGWCNLGAPLLLAHAKAHAPLPLHRSRCCCWRR